MAKIISEQSNPQFLESFISVYEEHDFLWNIEHSDWKNTIKRLDTLCDIGKKFNLTGKL